MHLQQRLFGTSRQARILRYAIVTLLILPWFFVRIDAYGSPLVNELLDGGHIGVFFILGWALFPLLQRSRLRNSVILLSLTLVVSFAIELIQDQVGRAFQYEDIVRNFLGMGLSLSLRLLLVAKSVRAKVSSTGLLLTVLLLCVLELAPLLRLLAGQAYFVAQRPVLASFEYAFERQNWSATRSTLEQKTGALWITSKSGAPYSGTMFRDFPKSWRAYSALAVTLENPGQDAYELTLKITDLKHDKGQHSYQQRFNLRINLEPGLQTLEVPISDIENGPVDRLLNLDEINRIEVFFSHKGDARTFVIHDLALN